MFRIRHGARALYTCTNTSRHHGTANWQARIKPGDKVYVGMSGGVDSSVAAYLLKSQNYDVEAIFMRNWDTRDERGECPSTRDYHDVQRVCAQLDIKCHQIDLVKQYWNQVFSTCLDVFAAGQTPNPDILCNSQIKFGVLLDEIDRRLHTSGAWFATGHYARTTACETHPEQVKLLRGVDRRKDQSYYLSGVSGRRLSRAVFPLGSLIKSQHVRQIARDARLVTAEKEESMGICFVGERRRFDKFLAEYLPQREGDVVASNGRVIGRHHGLFTKTIGQAASIPGVSGMNGKWYIYAKDPVKNCMYAALGRENPLLFSNDITAGPMHWIAGTAPEFGPDNRLELDAQVRDHISVRFRDAQFGVASGQYLTLYQGDVCLGSAPIGSTTDTASNR
ncbi:hypothetical protein IWW43_005089 [Coemansia sp. RSA 1935]|nr:hypothetical protein IWW43_005089 [Coemansia sp. RSA 1935]